MENINIKEMLHRPAMNVNYTSINPGIGQINLFSEIQARKRESMRERVLSTKEFLSLFDRAESLKMAYIPHFMTQCVVYYLELLLSYAKENRLYEYKKHTRRLKDLKEEYYTALRHEMSGKIFQKFLAQRDEYLASCGSNLTLMYFTFANQILKHHGRVEHECIFCYANIIVAFVEYVEKFDSQVNTRIAEKVGRPCRNYGDARLTDIKNVCLEIKSCYPVQANKDTELCIDVMANKAIAMIKTML